MSLESSCIFYMKDTILYQSCVFVMHESYDDADPIEVTSCHIRPRSRHIISLEDVEIGSRVFVNYNYDEPTSRGYWYDAIVTSKKNTRTVHDLYATVYIGYLNNSRMSTKENVMN